MGKKEIYGGLLVSDCIVEIGQLSRKNWPRIILESIGNERCEDLLPLLGYITAVKSLLQY